MLQFSDEECRRFWKFSSREPHLSTNDWTKVSWSQESRFLQRHSVSSTLALSLTQQCIECAHHSATPVDHLMDSSSRTMCHVTKLLSWTLGSQQLDLNLEEMVWYDGMAEWHQATWQTWPNVLDEVARRFILYFNHLPPRNQTMLLCLYYLWCHVLKLTLFSISSLLFQHTDLCQYMDKHPGGLHPDNVKVRLHLFTYF